MYALTQACVLLLLLLLLPACIAVMCWQHAVFQLQLSASQGGCCALPW